MTENAFARLLADRSVVVCVGSGGVGKTTTSAVIALHEAIRGRKVLVLTIDPARRLANSLGVDELGNDIVQIPIDRFEQVGVSAEGELWAMMLDMKESFDHVVRTYAPPKERDEILNNRIYTYFSTSLAGTQEYAAAERLHEIHETGDFDLIVLDTPPTTHALDFLEAPRRLEDAIDNKALQWIYKPGVLAGKKGLGIFSTGTAYVVKTLARFTGAELLDEFSVFLRSFSTLFDGLRERSQKVRDLLTSDQATFVVVTAPDPLTLDEALDFYGRLGDEQVQVGGFVVNRVHTEWVDADELDRPLVNVVSMLGEASSAFDHLGPDALREFAERLVQNARDFEALSSMDRKTIERLTRAVPDHIPIRRVPFFSTDIHSLRGLELVRRALFSQS